VTDWPVEAALSPMPGSGGHRGGSVHASKLVIRKGRVMYGFSREAVGSRSKAAAGYLLVGSPDSLSGKRPWLRQQLIGARDCVVGRS
jgi:hypothetical protein